MSWLNQRPTNILLAQKAVSHSGIFLTISIDQSIRQALGHQSISSTMAYVGTSDAQAAEALQKALMGLF